MNELVHDRVVALSADAAGIPEDAEPARTEIVVGTTVRGGRSFAVPMEKLRMHTAVVGAAGSGKTVLIKRLVEQCALRCVSAIVLDPNEDLARLGDPWARPPKAWTDDHEREARRYFADGDRVDGLEADLSRYDPGDEYAWCAAGSCASVLARRLRSALHIPKEHVAFVDACYLPPVWRIRGNGCGIHFF